MTQIEEQLAALKRLAGQRSSNMQIVKLATSKKVF